MGEPITNIDASIYNNKLYVSWGITIKNRCPVWNKDNLEVRIRCSPFIEFDDARLTSSLTNKKVARGAEVGLSILRIATVSGNKSIERDVFQFGPRVREKDQSPYYPLYFVFRDIEWRVDGDVFIDVEFIPRSNSQLQAVKEVTIELGYPTASQFEVLYKATIPLAKHDETKSENLITTDESISSPITGEYVFISYRSINSEFASELARDLVARGVRVWMDRLEGIVTGDDWVMELQDGVTNSAGLIAILTPDYARSKWCRRESKRADTLGKEIIPILLEDIDMSDWPMEIQERQYIDLRGLTVENAGMQIKELVKVINNKLPSVISSSIMPSPPAICDTAISEKRKLEDELASANTVLRVGSFSSSSLVQRKRERLEQRVAMLLEQWELANNQMDSTLNASDTPPLRMQIEAIEQKLNSVQAEIDRLTAS
jgi:hypothetical protein